MNRLKEKYIKEIRPALVKEFELQNPYEVPMVKKVVVSIGVGSAVTNKKDLEGAMSDLALICGQKPAFTRAKKSIAAFKVRQGNEIGTKVTLRGDRMYAFLDKLFTLVFPRVRDFQGLPLNAFDGQGNYSIGMREQIVFLEIEFGKIDKIRGLQITIVTNTNSDEQAKLLLQRLGLPFEKKDKKR
ncbi:50S ribosomal protein L5 [candidate division CPR3 bacterium GWF2_35_18]|uniref:Large ribosomal subunit protein uL5 n=1 Tax=candidate division CPR3 bacterium GW2011_GWF2_35_18 TaxID=1618350 RepID=A0A0G0C0P2_UNCC3|nr:MAG: 50S ribosomal protein L5 [candidate division CPR3 bacterium GW2011_GWF2_35_18]KKP86073.1 MAG: 50S ribosomal protein L5 [candidate division CPR3 bacterium GW2011_GWE2_35_7]OGB63160.1 MAG: 50S ribosomal protein L5 [candidate division CPR3 bacterium GWF2_35_18]OGB64026.1 MAG: 50S ribosomal protein L5 [candidate division CPR3 bacterium RIFOXYA2_FULL_35_13]OGB75704.1 MAG: 50S ribosomal protein L5 [candidate division CPR3 bacterium RIFOXYC2_FULL_35_7]OGB79613.1 MAG: 50S ribosomal protein L5 